MRSPTGETVLSRRRLTTSLGVSAYDLFLQRDKVADPMAPEINFKARLRYDADYGASPDETNPANTARLIPGFDRGPVDLMYAYIEGRHFLSHTLDFKIGRQYVTDALGWWSFDGAEAKITSPYYVAVEVYGGIEERGGMPLSTGRFEADGAWRGDRTGFNTALAPSFEQNSNAPAFGAALETAGFTWLHSRLSYRRVYNTGESLTSFSTNGLTSPVSYDGTRVSSDQVGYSLEADAAKVGAFKGGFAYDLYNVKMSNMYASIDAFATKKLIVSLDYDYVSPTFDADSIFNFFDIQPMNDFGVRADVDATDRLSFAGGAHARAFRTETSPQTGTGTGTGSTAPQSPNVNTTTGNVDYFPANALSFDGGGNLAVRYKHRLRRGTACARTEASATTVTGSAATSMASAPWRRAFSSTGAPACTSGTTSCGRIGTRRASATRRGSGTSSLPRNQASCSSGSTTSTASSGSGFARMIVLTLAVMP